MALRPPTVRIRAPGGEEHELQPGALVGRVASAALLVDDPRISEAHALLSLRRGRFLLLALRRLLLVDQLPVREVELRPGVRVGLATGLELEVLDVHIPARTLAVDAPGLGRRRLGPVASLFGGPPPRVLGRFEASAPCHVWSLAEGWRLRLGDDAPRALEAGDRVELAGHVFTFVEVALGAAASTHRPEGALAPLRLVTFFDGVEIHREGHPVMTVGGVGARILSELASFGGPTSWRLIAGEVWKDAADRAEFEIRQRWDTSLRRLRQKLEEAEVRADLIRADGTGCFHLVLAPGDEVEDRT
ncbi:MAG: hypothetical protein H6722_22495 [Sandaracinus sp.]|nr:hypothetical protein [Sandaracinus sp.]